MSALLLTVFKEKSSIITVVLCALLTGCMHGVNLMLVCTVPVYFKKYGNVSFVSGLLNFCTYVGSAIAIYGFARVSEGYGWNITLIVWSVIALAGGLVCFGISKKWDEFCA